MKTLTAIALARTWDWTCPNCNEENESEDIPSRGIEVECEHCGVSIKVVAG